MKSNQTVILYNDQFHGLTGVKHTAFIRMVAILREADRKKKGQRGRKNKVCIEDQLL